MGMTITTAEPRGAGLLRPGPAARLGLQPRRGAAVLRPCRQARPELRHVLLGRGLRDGAEHQRRDGRGRHPARLGGDLARSGAAGAVTAKEAALIEALAARYAADPSAERAALDQAWADAIAKVAAAYPEDAEIQVLYADAMMNLQPWDYWEADGVTPKGYGGEIVAVLERALALAPGSSRRRASLHPRGRGLGRSRPGRGGGGRPARRRAGGGAPDAHARAYLRPGRSPPRLDRREP